MTAPGLTRSTSSDSSRISWTTRGSLSDWAAISTALADGSIPPSSTRRPSAFETIFCASTTTSPACNAKPDAARASRTTPVRSSPALTSGTPSSARSVNSAGAAMSALLGQAGDAYAGVRDLIGPVDRDQHRGQRFGDGGVAQRPGIDAAQADGLRQRDDG